MQAARSKELKRARNILVVIGVLTIVANAAFAANAKNEVDKEINKQVAEARSHGMVVDMQKVDRVRVSALRITYLVHGVPRDPE